jgi:hypothetical protein
MVCLGNMCMDTLNKGDSDDDDDDNNNNNNKWNVFFLFSYQMPQRIETIEIWLF